MSDLYRHVKVLQMTRSPEEYDNWRLNLREPYVGEVGAIVDKLHAPNAAEVYVVECVDKHSGQTL